jgi:hypothetical protein
VAMLCGCDLWPFRAPVAIVQTASNPSKWLDSRTSALLWAHKMRARGDGSHEYRRWFGIAVILP